MGATRTEIGQWADFAVYSLATLAISACGDGVAEPIVADFVAPAVTSPPTPVEESPPTGETLQHVGGLCNRCPEDGRCGDANDLCLENHRTDERFCARDCDEGRDCPDGYDCRRISNAEPQCVPFDGSCRDRDVDGEPPPIAEIRRYMLEEINELRESAGRAPLAADTCLDDLAQSAALELATENETAAGVQDSCGWAFETRGVVANWELRWQQAATALWQNPSITSRPRGIERDLLSDDWLRLGIGILLGGDEAWIALTYGR